MAWLTLPVVSGGVTRGLVVNNLAQCMAAPTFTLFSDTTSARAWNADHPHDLIVPIESPDNFIHLAVGGFDIASYNASPILGANRDMGREQHCSAGADLLLPPLLHRLRLLDLAAPPRRDAEPDDRPGRPWGVLRRTSCAGSYPGDMLTMTRALIPFAYDDGSWMTSADCVDIEEQLGYSYGPGSLDVFAEQSPGWASEVVDLPLDIHLAGIDRSKVAGSFVVAAYGMSTAFSSSGGRRRPQLVDGVRVRELPDAPARQRRLPRARGAH